MLAEVFMLRLETTLRGTAPATTTQTSSAPFVPFTGGIVGRPGKGKVAKKG